MTWQTNFNAFVTLREYLQSNNEELELAIISASQHNNWFTVANIKQSINAITTHYLAPEKLNKWITAYEDKLADTEPKTIGLIMAGNIPLVGFHDLICVLASGNNALIKLSSKDKILTNFILKVWLQLCPELKERITITERFVNFDAIIATGSDNSSRYFDYYFSKYPNIIRKNRNSVAVLTGNESDEEILALGQDIFQYFGLGCRNVSKLFVPEGYDLVRLLTVWEKFNALRDHNKYKNNLDYNATLLIMNQSPHLASDYLILKEDRSLTPRIACVHYQIYKSIDEVKEFIDTYNDKIQCIVSFANAIPGLKPGQAQSPELWDYADNVDTMEFLLGLN